MIEKGEYKVIQCINISYSLLSQSEEEPTPHLHNIDKAVLERDSIQLVVYFVEHIDFGFNTIISINKNIECPLLSKCDYKIIEHFGYIHNTKLVKALLHKI